MSVVKPYQTIIIGKGLVGSAAAKYLSRSAGDVAIIGPDEPADPQEATVHAAHYDEARVQRIQGWDEVWTTLNRESANAYPQLQSATGIHFHQGAGCLYVDPYGGDDYLRQAADIISNGGSNAQMFATGKEMKKAFPDFLFPAGSMGMYEPAPSGYINPRRLVRAQLAMAAEQGTTILKETVIGLEEKQGLFTAVTNDGHRYEARQVLVATGSFANHMNILPQKLQLRTKGETVLLVRTDDQTKKAMIDLPSLLYEIDQDGIEGVYLLPPVSYPDGATYLKIGCNFPEDPSLQSLEEIREWFIAGDSDRFVLRLVRTLSAIMPRLPILEYATKRCIVSYTPDRRPYIGQTGTTGLFVAGGCNGYSAMASDAMGRVAAELMLTGDMPFSLEPGDFTLRYADARG